MNCRAIEQVEKACEKIIALREQVTQDRKALCDPKNKSPVDPRLYGKLYGMEEAFSQALSLLENVLDAD